MSGSKAKIVVGCLFTVKPTHVEAFISAAKIVQEASNEEKGCLHYRFNRDIVQANVFRLYEEWDSKSELGGHLTTEHVAKFNSACADILESVEISPYVAESFTLESLV